MFIFAGKIKRLIGIALLFALILTVGSASAMGKLSISDFGDRGLDAFLQASGNGVPVESLVGIWLYEERDIGNPDAARLDLIASILATRNGQSERVQLAAYVQNSAILDKIQAQAQRMSNILYVLENKVFPLPKGASYWYGDNWMAYRDFGGERSHEGIDIMCEPGTPVIAVCDGVIERIGWNTLGGWRVGLRGNDGIYYYYAHLSGYGEDMYAGKSVKKGRIIGYSGSTGYGPEGTDDVLIPHLHFGMYAGIDHKAVNAYPFLRFWE